MSGAAQLNPAQQFLARYQHDWVLLVREVLGADPDANQEMVLNAACRGERRISLRSGHGVGKSTVLAWCILCHALTRYPQKVVCTAPTSSQLFDALASETKAWFKKLPAPLLALYDVKSESITLVESPDESFISFKTSRPDTPEALAGVHSEHVLLIGDEASGIPEQVFEAAAGSMSGHNATTILAGNPVRTSGLFFDTHNKLANSWLTIHISCVGHPRISPDFVRDMAERYGEDSNAYRVRVLGEFPKGDDDTVIPLELVDAARKRDVGAHAVKPVWGVDCARFGSDRSTLCRRRGNVQEGRVESWKGLDTMELVGRVKAAYDDAKERDKPEWICVDVIGLGAGVVDRLREQGLPVRGINVSESPALGDKYRNLRAELWFTARDWFARRDSRLEDSELGTELVAVRYNFASNGKQFVESKDDMKKRGVRSPDLADAFVLTFAVAATQALHGSSQRTAWDKPLRRTIGGIV